MTAIHLGGDSAELIRAVSKAMIGDPDVLRLVHDAVMGTASAPFASNPSIVEAIGEAVRENTLHWTRAMYEHPLHPVEPNLSSQVISVAREGFRWGAEGALRAAYRAGEQAMWSEWMRFAFSRCDDGRILLPALDQVSRSLAQWTEATSSALLDLLEKERKSLSSDAQVRRLELVNLVLGGAPAAAQELQRTAAYPMRAPHLSVIISAPPQVADRTSLVRAAGVVSRLTGSAKQLLVHASASSVWLWVTPVVPVVPGDLEEAAAAADVRFAVGTADAGVDGFRRSHHRALEAHRLVDGERRVVLHDDVAAVLLLAQEGPRLHEFVHAALGPLASGPPELRDTLRVFIRERYNATETARLLFTHRNTVLQRIRRAEQLLPMRLERHGATIGLALDAVYWLHVSSD